MTELNKYKNGKVYKIEPIVDHDEGDIYIGSTCQPYLCSRMNQHRTNYKCKKNEKNCKVSLLFDKYGIENCNIILIESIEANNKMELHQREAYYIRTLRCINKKIPLRTDKEYYETNKYIIKEKQKEYNEDHKKEKEEYDKKYNEANKEKIKIKNKKYKEVNKEKIKETYQQWYEENKDAINARRKELYQLKKQQKQII